MPHRQFYDIQKLMGETAETILGQGWMDLGEAKIIMNHKVNSETDAVVGLIIIAPDPRFMKGNSEPSPLGNEGDWAELWHGRILFQPNERYRDGSGTEEHGRSQLNGMDLNWIAEVGEGFNPNTYVHSMGLVDSRKKSE